MAISNLFPSEGPTLNLNFASSRTLDRRITFTRTTGATYTGRDGFLKTAVANEPRFHHQYINGQTKSLGLFVEEPRTTYQTNTENPSQWNISNMVPTGVTITLPNGEQSSTIEYRGATTNADNKFIRPTTHSSSSITAGDTWTYSGFYRKGTTNGERYVHLVLQNNTASQGIGRRFDFDTGTWATTLGLNNVTDADSGYDEYPNGWYRIWMTCTFPSAASGIQTFTRLFANSTSIPYDTSFSLWGTQLEKAKFRTSYISNNTTSTATRNPDRAFITGTKFSEWYNPNEGTLFAKARSFGAAPELTGVAALNVPTDGTQRVDIRYHQGGVSYVGFNSPPGLVLARTSGFDLPDPRFIVGYKTNIQKFAANGSLTSGTQNFTPSPNITHLQIGTFDNFSYELNGCISQLTYYPMLLSDAQLQNLTK